MSLRGLSRKIIFVLSLYSIAWSLAAIETDFSTTLSVETGTPLPYAENRGEFLIGNVKADEAVTVYATDNVTFFANASAVYDALAQGGSEYDCSSDDNKFALILKEAWFDYNAEFWGIRIGRQISSWGKADVLKVTDVLCPSSYNSLNIQEAGDAVLGIDAVRLSGHGDAFSLDFYWIPFVRADALPTGENHPVQKTLSQYTHWQIAPTKTPEISFANSEFGVKASGYWKWGDASLYGFYGWDRFPAEFDMFSEGKLIIEGKTNRFLMIGADVAVPVGDVVVRAEGAFFYDRAITTFAKDILEFFILIGDPQKTYVTRNEVKALVGVDWMPSGWVLSAQYYGDVVLGDMSPIFSRDRYVHVATAAASRSFFKDTLSLSLAGILQFETWNHAIALLSTYSVTDQFSLYAKLLACNIMDDNIADDIFSDFYHWGAVTAGMRLKL